MTNLDEKAQVHALNNFKEASFMDRENTYRQYTVTGFQLGGWKRSELKLYTSVGHILEYVRGKGIRVYSESGSTSTNCTAGTESRRKLLGGGGAPAQSALQAIIDTQYGSGIDGQDDAAKNALIESSLPNLKNAVNDATAAASATVANMAANGWATDTDAWEGVVMNAISKNFGYSAASQYKSAYWADNLQAKMDALAGLAASQASYGGTTGDVEETTENAFEIYSDLYSYAAGGPGSVVYDQSGLGLYEKGVAELGYDGFVLSEANTIIASIASTTTEQIDSWDTFKTTGYIGAIETTTAAYGSSTYGCGTKDVAYYEGENTSGGEMVYHVCTGDGTGTAGKLMGGYFFSEIIGSYEAFIMMLPGDFCAEFGKSQYDKVDSKTGKHYIDFGGAHKSEYFLYLMHGWGESGVVLVEASDTISFLMSDGAAINFLTICAEDNGSPYGGKSWYVNNVFTGFHQDMIVFELPEYLYASMGLDSWNKGIYGFSMGAAGSLNIGFTYSNVYGAIAAFNGPVEGDECFFCGYCHVYCGVDSFKCEIMWSSPQAAYNPYVIVAVGGYMQTMGYYDPSAYGIASLAASGSWAIAQCSGEFIVGKKGGELVAAYSKGGAKYGGGEWDTGAWYDLTLAAATMGDEMQATYFYLDAALFTRSSSGFDPSHNPITGAQRTDAFEHMYYQFAMQRAYWNTDILNHGVTFFLVACDFNDQYGLSDMAFHIASIFTGYEGGEKAGGGGAKGAMESGYSMSSGSGVIHDGHNGCGHCMDLRDFRLAYAFMSDVFDTMAQSSDGDGYWSGSGDWAVKTANTCASYMTGSFLNVQSFIGSLDVSSACLSSGNWNGYDDIMGEWGGDLTKDTKYMAELAKETAAQTADKSGKTCWSDTEYASMK
jgi:hypothetical protein